MGEDDIPGRLLDVREKSEFEAEHVAGAMHIESLIDDQIDNKQSYYVYSNYGCRSKTFISLMREKGYDNLININGGLEAIKENGRFYLAGSIHNR
jgi:rhodanese-related sulfurtransferase